MTNKSYTPANYSVAIEVTKSPEQVFNHIINEVARFWPEQLEGKCNQLNDEFVFRSGTDHYSKNKVVERVPQKTSMESYGLLFILVPG